MYSKLDFNPVFIFFLVACIFCTDEIYGQKPILPDISAGVSSSLTCKNTSVILKGSSKTVGVYYIWSGPNGYTSTAQSPITTMPGEYFLTVNNPTNGGIAKASVKVLVDTVPPSGIKATVSGLFTCADTLATLSVNSTTVGVMYDWNGPKGYSSNNKNSVTSIPGIYLAKVINPINGCSSAVNVSVAQNITPPSGVSATVSGLLTCKVSSVMLSATSATKDVSYCWSGKGFKSAVKNPVITTPGIYELKVTNPVNGCSSRDSVQVEQNIAIPALVTAEAIDSLTCKNKQVTLKASSATKEVDFEWLGPKAFTSKASNLKTSIAGNFTLTATNLENGCSTKKSVVVVTDTIPPEAMSTVTTGTLTCIAKTVTLTGLTSSPKLIFNWNGPNNFVSNMAAPIVSTAGKYNVKITNQANGCSSSSSVKVDENIAAPEGVAASVLGSISCGMPSVRLNGSATLDKVTYTWSGPQDFLSTKRNPETTLPGEYTLTATNPWNGCTTKANVTVTGVLCNNK